MKKNLITGLTLSSFALICAVLLAIVNLVTKPIIQKKNEKTINDSISIVCEYYNETDYTKEEVTKDAYSQVKSAYLIKDKDGNVKSAIYVIDYQGFASTIEMMISISSDHKVEGYTVISANETKNGDLLFTHDFNMTGKDTMDDFDKISGSSVSSKAVRKCFNLALYLSYEDMEVTK